MAGELETVYAAQLERLINTQATRLRTLADALTQAARQVGDLAANGARPGNADYAHTAERVQHEVLWGLANLRLEGLLTASAEADAARVAGT